MNAPQTRAVLLDLIASPSHKLEPQPTEIASKLKSIPGIRAVVFDVYGTLFISSSGDISLARKENRESALRSVLVESGFQCPSQEVHLSERFHDLIRQSHVASREQGIDFPEVEIREIWRRLLGDSGIAGDASESDVEALALRFEMRVNSVWPMPGLAATLEDLRRRGFSLGIISNAQFYTPLLFHSFLGQLPEGIGFDKELCIWSYCERIGKPSQRLFELSVKNLKARGIRPQEAIYVGNDMRNDILPAARAGMRTALFAGDARSLRLRETSPDSIPADLVVKRLDELVGCLS